MSSSSSDIPNFKCITLGDSFTGKTTLVRRLLSETSIDKVKFKRNYFVYPIIFSTNLGTIAFEIHDMDGRDMLLSARDSFFRKSDCALIIFDLTSPSSFENILFWHRKVLNTRGAIPMAICGNKIDIKSRKVSKHEIMQSWGKRLKYFDISAKNKISTCEPFLYLAEKLLKRGKIKEFTKIGSEVSIGLNSLHRILEEKKEKNEKFEDDFSKKERSEQLEDSTSENIKNHLNKLRIH